MGQRPLHVAVIADTSGAYGRGVIRGISRYALSHGNWQLDLPGMWDFAERHDLAGWRGDGVLAEVHHAPLRQRLTELGRPVVDLANTLADAPFPRATADDRAVGRMAAEHFLNLGYKRFGYCGYAGMAVSADRCEGYVARLAEAGVDPASVAVANAGEEDLGRWSASLDRPAAVLAMSDGPAHRLIEAARSAGVAIPEDLAVLGVDDDAFRSALINPSPSSIALPTERIGYEAAALLDRLMAGGVAPTMPLLFQPVGVVERQSTDVTAIEDGDVAAAVRYIREHADRPVRVEDVLGEVAISRRSLEQRFRRHLGRSILDELHRAHAQRAKQLLAGTDLPMPEVARRSGFSNTNRFNIIFRTLTGQTPTDYRTSVRPR